MPTQSPIDAPQRWIMHIDMDAFFASIEQLDHPEWRGQPLVVGGRSGRGVVAAASYEARKYGLHSAMPMSQALKLCPRVIVTPGRRERYAELSRLIMTELHNFSPVMEQASIDEAFLDATGLERLFGSVEELGRKVKDAVKQASGLNCSVGIAPVKFLAKIASDYRKPNGLYIITPEMLPAFIAALPLGKIPGLGRQMMAKLEKYGMITAGDAQRFPESFWIEHFGKMGRVVYERCRGIDHRNVEPYTKAKSESAENTFERDTNDLELLKTWLLRQSERVGASLRKHGQQGRTITLKVKYADFKQLTRSLTLPMPTNSTRLIYETAVHLLEQLAPRQKLRLIGVGVSLFTDDDNAPAPPEALTLPGLKLPMEAQASILPPETLKKESALDAALDCARQRFGKNAVVRGRLFTPPEK